MTWIDLLLNEGDSLAFLVELNCLGVIKVVEEVAAAAAGAEDGVDTEDGVAREGDGTNDIVFEDAEDPEALLEEVEEE